MGSGASKKAEVTKYSIMFQKVLPCGVQECDNISLQIDEIIKRAEQIRFQTLTSRDLLFRISKVNLFSGATLTHAFKVWAWTVGACNQGDLNKVELKINFEDLFKNDHAEKQVLGDPGSLPDMGKQVIKKVQNAVDDVIDKIQDFTDPNASDCEDDLVQNDVKFNLGQCASYKMKLWIRLFRNYLHWFKIAQTEFNFLLEEINWLVDKFKGLKDDLKYIQQLLEGTTMYVKAQIGVSLGVNMGQAMLAYKVAEQFSKFMKEWDVELKDFVQNYPKIWEECKPMATKIFKELGIKPYYKDANKTVLREKIIRVAGYLNLNNDPKLLEEYKLLKFDRLKLRTRLKDYLKWNDIYTEETIFPFKLRILGNDHYDRNFSAIAVGLSSWENSRKYAHAARKEMLKLTGAEKFEKKTVTSAFEIWTWCCSANKGGKLSALQLKLNEKEPFLVANTEKFKFSDEAEKFRSALTVWLRYFSPLNYKRQQSFLNTFQQRQRLLNKQKYDILKFFSSGDDPAKIYNSISQMDKNLLSLPIYWDRCQVLYQDIIVKNGEQGIELYAKANDILAQADTHGPAVKGIKMMEIADKHCPGYIANEEHLKQRQEQAKKNKETKQKRKWLWDE